MSDDRPITKTDFEESQNINNKLQTLGSLLSIIALLVVAIGGYFATKGDAAQAKETSDIALKKVENLKVEVGSKAQSHLIHHAKEEKHCDHSRDELERDLEGVLEKHSATEQAYRERLSRIQEAQQKILNNHEVKLAVFLKTMQNVESRMENIEELMKEGSP